MKIPSDGGLAEQHTSFPHFDSQYKCCCNAVHVRQGTQMVGIVCTIISTFGIFSTLFSKETPLVTALELLFLCIEVICIVFLFMALFNEKKNLLVPFMIWQFLSIIICIGLFIGCVNAIYKPDGYFGDWIQSYVIGQAVEVYSINGKDEKRLEETVDMKLLVRLCATLSAIAFFVSFLVTCWWLSVVYKCYRYFADMNRHREPFDRPVLYSVHYTNSAY